MAEAPDNTPISPIERRNSLEKHLQTRPDPQDLKDRHILLDTNAAPYVPSLTTPFTSEPIRCKWKSLTQVNGTGPSKQRPRSSSAPARRTA